MAAPYEVLPWTNPSNGKEDGRCMRATRDFNGEVEVVLKEEPVAHAARIEDVCDACLSALSGDVNTCSGCKTVMYCDQRCQKKAWKGWHKKECSMMASLRGDQDVKPTPTLLMTFRTLVACNGDLQHEVLQELVHHEDRMDQERRDTYAQLAVLLNSMCKRAGMAELAWPDALVLFSKLEVNSFSVMDRKNTTIGYAVYRKAASINHSCEPNMVATFAGRDIHLRPVRDINKGDELTVSYVELASLTSERNAELLKRYGFECACPRCSGTARAVEEEFPPSELAAGNQAISEMLDAQEFAAALTKCLELLPYMALYGCDMHPSVGLHWLTIAKLKWHLEDTEGTYEV
eukprot:TRINITY_DN7683_c0_g1_i1.p2 TRINITY_DN7683_c0_g1~~TRINITY_DN7683_c0_g1_i1.p2  ORF type:complete len:347 (+),score=108.67 TRINITY_DN7683_c0_g1_i1:1331-2371(+)